MLVPSDMIQNILRLIPYAKVYMYFTPGNVVRGNQTVMQKKSLRSQPTMSYGLDNYVNNKFSDPVLLFFDSFTARY